jgi:mono/diheme cytochrome c family protein
MRRLTISCIPLALCALITATILTASGQDPAAFYEENCASCHTIGEGVIGGPDLKGVTARRDREWLIHFMLEPEKFADDPVVKQMIKEADGAEMGSTEGLTREMAEAILTLIEKRSGIGAAPAVPERRVTDADEAMGRALFSGEQRLSASRTPCVACHTASNGFLRTGGRLGPELALVHDRLGGHRGLMAWLGSPPTPMMRALYRRAPLTEDEAHALAAFLAVPHHGPPAAPPGVPRFAAAGLAGAVLFFGAIGLVWSGRFRGVRRSLVAHPRDGQRTSTTHPGDQR